MAEDFAGDPLPLQSGCPVIILDCRKEDKGMAYHNKLYKQLSCRDFGADCDFVVRAKTEQEVLEYGYDHSCSAHAKCGSSPKTDERMRSLINNVWV